MPVPLRFAVLAVALAGCSDPGTSAPASAPSPADSLAAVAANPPFVGTWWRLASLGGEALTEGVRPVLIFTETPALRDTYDRPYPDSLHSWRIVTGDLGVGHLHAPYRRASDTLRFADPYDYTRLSTEAEIAQARRLAEALTATRTHRRDGPRLALLGAAGDTLATFTADPPRAPGPLDDIEWVLTHVGEDETPDGVRATLTFTSQRLGPGDGDGFSSLRGYSGCNSYGTGYRLAPAGDGRYRLTTHDAVVSTAMGCPPPASEIEAAVQGAVGTATHVRAMGDLATNPADDRLALLDSAGTALVAFRRHVPYAVDLGALRRGRWRLAASEVPYAVPGTEAAFADSTFEGRAGCFVVRGTYAVRGDDLFVPSQAGDSDGCTEAELREPRAVPLAAGKLSVSADRLVLYDRDGRASVFERAE